MIYDCRPRATGSPGKAAHGFLGRESVVVVVGNYLWYHVFYEVRGHLGMHLGFRELRRSHVAPKYYV